MTKPTPDHDKTPQPGEAQANAEEVGIEQLKAENAKLKEDLRRERENNQRNLADFNNYRDRIERERASADRAGKREMVLSLLDFMDDFERAFEHVEDSPASVRAGVSAIHRRLASLLEAQGVVPFESIGEPFDPALHEAVGAIESDEQEPGTVLDELSRGYRWGQELLRPARVRVAR